MAEIRALIVDDEPLARRGIRQLLAPFPEIVVAGECRDGREALRALATLKPDLVFLDVQMPGLDGIGVIRVHGPDRMPMTVFVTAHDAFAVQAFEARALDYLVKPLSETRFRAAMARVYERVRNHDAVAMARRLAGLLADGRDRPPGEGRGLPAPRPGGRIVVPTPTGDLLLDEDEIDWVGAADDQIEVHTGGRTCLIRESLNALEARLDPARFVRVHRSALVRLDRVRELRTGAPGREAVAILRDGTELPVSRRRLAQVRRLLRLPGRKD